MSKLPNRSRTKKESFSLSLFPFLAVLICTMGVLIVLLVIVVKHADHKAQSVRAEKAEEIQKKLTLIQNFTETEEFKLEELMEIREEVTNDLKENLQFRSNVQAQINSLRDEAKLLEDRYNRLVAARKTQTQQIANQESQLNAEISRLRLQMVGAQQELKRVLAEAKPAENVYAIVPYNGVGGTNRRPIFLECTSKAIWIQPYGIEITSQDFEGPIIPGNPLDAALLSIRDYYQKYAAQNRDGKPYPLLVVRPGGERAFASARRAMKSWVDEFGYELVAADKVLAYPPEDSNLKTEIEKSLKAARIRLDALKRRRRGPEMIAMGGGSKQFNTNSTETPSGNGSGETPTTNAAGFQSKFSNQASSVVASGLRGNNTASAHYLDEALKTRDFKAGNIDQSKLDSRFGSKDDRSVSGDRRNEPSRVANKGNRDVLDHFSDSTNESQGKMDTDAGGNGAFGARQPSQQKAGNPAPSTSLAASRGNDWALPSKSSGAVANRKPIAIKLFEDHMLIRSSNDEAIKIDLNGKTSEHIDKLINEIWMEIENWGIAGIRAYWKPVLNIHVYKGGLPRAKDLEKLLEKSGIDLEFFDRRTQ